MRKLLCKLFFLLSPLVIFGQGTDLEFRNQIKVSAFRAINFLNPGIEVGYERFFGNKVSTQFSVGIATNVLGKPFKDLRGYNIALEEKYFLSRNKKSGKYFSLELNHNDIKYQEKTTGVDTNTNLIIIDTFSITRRATSLSFKYGIQFYKKHFVLDLNFGTGLKYITVKHRDRTYEYKDPREPFDLRKAANVEKSGIAFYLPINIQLGYRF